MGQISAAGADIVPLDDGWVLKSTPADTCRLPSDIPETCVAIPAPVPGTVAGALERAGLFDRERPVPLNDRDHWYLRRLDDLQSGTGLLRFEGLATIADVYLDDRLVLSTDSMFETHDLEIGTAGAKQLAICFRALQPRLEKSGPRARWRPKMMRHQGLRLFRTTLLGHMPGWCPEIEPVGPFRPVVFMRENKTALADLALRSSLEGRDCGLLTLRFKGPAEGSFALECAGHREELARDADGFWSGNLRLDGIEPWFPHTHGRPVLYDVTLHRDGNAISLGKTGFRRIDCNRGADGKGFGLVINDVPVFCRGAVWTNADIVDLPGSRNAYEPLLAKAVDAGMNMIRIGGTMAYETAAFFAVGDELGLLVWQDFLFANFDYPVKDEAFVAHVEREVKDQLRPISASPSLAVLCGGSEMHQQATMLGLPKAVAEGLLTSEILPGLANALRPDVPYVPNSPFGGSMPFSANEGVTHYYGVGAYERPLEDARRADVRFSAESLAFSQVPEQRLLDRCLPVPALHDPRWKARVPRDRDASWDFEDTRDFYLGLIYDLDPAKLRREDPARYLELSRAVTGEVSEAVFAEWRRLGSNCQGGLVWTFKDLMPGPGWGILDSAGEAKPVFHALKRAFRPVQVLLLDEGTNGLDVHVINETGNAIDCVLQLAALRDGRTEVVSARQPLSLEPRSSLRLAATDLVGGFFDFTYAFRFGPPSHDVVTAQLFLADGGLALADAFHFPLGRAKAMHQAEIEASLLQEEEGWSLMLTASQLAQSVHVISEGHVPEENWFHLAPGKMRKIRLAPRTGTDPAALPTGTIHALGGSRVVSF